MNVPLETKNRYLRSNWNIDKTLQKLGLISGSKILVLTFFDNKEEMVLKVRDVNDVQRKYTWDREQEMIIFDDYVVHNKHILRLKNHNEVHIGNIYFFNFSGDIDIKDEDLYMCQLYIEQHLHWTRYTQLKNDKKIQNAIFLANMSHEIRTPLNGIIGYSQLLSNTSLNDKQHEYLSNMNKCNIQLMKIINDLIDFSKLNWNKMKINQEYFNINEVTTDIHSLLLQSLQDKEIRLSFHTENIKQYIYCDKQKLMQILLNLITNAIKHSPYKGRIDIYLKNVTSNMLEIRVKDKGCGIPLDKQRKIFEIFSQAKNIDSLNGFGLGLSITKMLVELLKGVIKVHSVVGEGTEFTFTIKTEEYSNLLDTSSSILKHKHVLVVDHDVSHRLRLSDICFKMNMIPIICASTQEALHLIKQKRYVFHLFVVDTQLAIELYEHIDRKKIIEFGTTKDTDSEFMVKPVQEKQLFNTILAVLAKSNALTHALRYSTQKKMRRKT